MNMNDLGDCFWSGVYHFVCSKVDKLDISSRGRSHNKVKDKLTRAYCEHNSVILRA